jgi:hypothetical protein
MSLLKNKRQSPNDALQQRNKQTKASSTTKKRYTYVRLLHLVVMGEGGDWKKLALPVVFFLMGGSNNVIVIRYYVPSFHTGRVGRGGPVGRSARPVAAVAG